MDEEKGKKKIRGRMGRTVEGKREWKRKGNGMVMDCVEEEERK